jgi:hypothetical protein
LPDKIQGPTRETHIWKILYTTSHQGNANQSCNEISCHLRKETIQKTEVTNTGRDVEKETLILCGWDCKLVQPLGKTVWRFFKKLKIESPDDPSILPLGIYSQKK